MFCFVLCLSFSVLNNGQKPRDLNSCEAAEQQLQEKIQQFTSERRSLEAGEGKKTNNKKWPKLKQETLGMCWYIFCFLWVDMCDLLFSMFEP